MLLTYYMWIKAVKTGSIYWAAKCALAYFYMVTFLLLGVSVSEYLLGSADRNWQGLLGFGTVEWGLEVFIVSCFHTKTNPRQAGTLTV